ncbi:type II CRISPR RNA-guided endonuclease Cas9 [Mycoplasma sp. ATU-Cv-508]|uniref:type II CRISPR RNA-guided endonuclease Cas9 n=1 Tax=Mycoplasma sp. ATU-Cv-508 TaxID=2048001 RepID=UPI000FDD83F9
MVRDQKKVTKCWSKELPVNSPYSRYYIDKETGKLESHPNMWARTIGKCTYLPDQNRAPKNSLTAEVFNLLNDLNNVWMGNPDNKSDRTHLSLQDKIKCLEIALKTKANTNKIIAYLMATYNMEEQDFKGFRVEGKHGEWKPLVTPLTSFHLVNNVLKKFDRELKLDDLFDGHQFKLEIVDNIVDVFSEFKSVEDRRVELSEINSPILNREIIEELSQVKGARFSENHSLSYKAMRMMLPELLQTSKNQMEIAEENDLFQKKSRLQAGDNLVYLPKNGWMNWLLLPQLNVQFDRLLICLIQLSNSTKNIKFKMS